MEVISADPSSLCVYLFHHSNFSLGSAPWTLLDRNWGWVGLRLAVRFADRYIRASASRTHGPQYVSIRRLDGDPSGVGRHANGKSHPQADAKACSEGDAGCPLRGPKRTEERAVWLLFQPFFCNRIDFFLKFKKH